jgi:hypothetical protein
LARPSRESRAERRDAAARAALEPLGPGERPASVTVAAIVAAVLGVANVLAYYVADVHIRGQARSAVGAVLLAVILFVAAAGMWRLRYWAVLGFQALLALTIIYATLSLAVAANLAAMLLSAGVIGLAGFLFYKLVRAMARIQMPRGETPRGEMRRDPPRAHKPPL